MLGEIIQSEKTDYTIIELIYDGDSSNIYLCKDTSGNIFILKHFYGRYPIACDGRSIHNHYGGKRDGSEVVFKEIQDKNNIYNFLIKHIDRILHNGKATIILEYIEGDNFRDFISKNESDISKIHDAVIALAETIATWHKNGLAHGDPHLDNVRIQSIPDNKIKAVLIDYNMIHHNDFRYCKEIGCFENITKRMEEDLVSGTRKLGQGFRSEIIDLECKMELGTTLSELFDFHYHKNYSPALPLHP